MFPVFNSKRKFTLREPDCLCITCGVWFHHLGNMSHRAAHRRRNERCEIEFSDGRVVDYRFDRRSE